MRRGKRNYVVVSSSSGDEEDDKDEDFQSTSGRRFSKSAPARKNPKRERASCASTFSYPIPAFSSFDEVKRACAEFDKDFSRIKVTPGSTSHGDLWVEKHKPCCLQELAVHKKKVEQIRDWFEEKLKNPKGNSNKNVIILYGQAGVGKSATIHLIAGHLGAVVYEWRTPIPVVWEEHVHNINSGVHYISKLDHFESFVEKIRKYGLSLSSTRDPPPPYILLIDDLPVVNGKVSYERLHRCLHLLLESVCVPTAIIIDSYGQSESTEQYSRHLEELQLSLQSAGAFKVTFNPVTITSTKNVLKRICKLERIELDDKHVDLIANASGGDIRQAINSLQYLSLASPPLHSLSLPLNTNGDESSHSLDRVCLPFGKDETLSLFHALGKFLHNKRQTGSPLELERGTIPLGEKFLRLPLKMDTPELIVSQAHGQARLIVDFFHENVLDFVSNEAIEDAWIISSYLSDSDMLLASMMGSLRRNFRVDNVTESAATSIAARGVLFGNSHSVSPGWHAIRRPALWQAERSLWTNKLHLQQSQRTSPHISISSSYFSAMVTEFKPALKWLEHRLHEDQFMETDDDQDAMDDDDEIEDW